jgi:hypothetical protein
MFYVEENEDFRYITVIDLGESGAKRPEQVALF